MVFGGGFFLLSDQTNPIIPYGHRHINPLQTSIAKSTSETCNSKELKSTFPQSYSEDVLVWLIISKFMQSNLSPLQFLTKIVSKLHHTFYGFMTTLIIVIFADCISLFTFASVSATAPSNKCCHWQKSPVSWAALCWWPEGNVYGHGKLLTVMYAVIKRYKGSPRKFVLLQNSSPDVQREGGGGKTNISLLESLEDWAVGFKNINKKRQNTKIWWKRRR